MRRPMSLLLRYMEKQNRRANSAGGLFRHQNAHRKAPTLAMVMGGRCLLGGARKFLFEIRVQRCSWTLAATRYPREPFHSWNNIDLTEGAADNVQLNVDVGNAPQQIGPLRARHCLSASIRCETQRLASGSTPLRAVLLGERNSPLSNRRAILRSA